MVSIIINDTVLQSQLAVRRCVFSAVTGEGCADQMLFELALDTLLRFDKHLLIITMSQVLSKS